MLTDAETASLNRMIELATGGRAGGVAALAAALVEVDRMPNTTRSIAVRVALINGIEAACPEAAAAVVAALNATPEGTPFDYVAVLVGALPEADQPSGTIAEQAVAINAALSSATGKLTTLERGMLDLEAAAVAENLQAGEKLNRIRALGFAGDLAYYQRLNALIRTERALAAAPVLVHRITRQQRAAMVRRGVRASV